MKRLQVQDWMTPDPITVDRNANLSTVYHLMRLNEIRRLPVVDARGKLIGIVTRGDLREARPTEHATLGRVSPWELHILAATLEVKDFMTTSPFTVTPEAPIREAARLMLTHKIGGLPVVENEQVVGILTESDLFRFIVEQVPSTERDLMMM